MDAERRGTTFSDVCGTMDELKRLLYEEPERVVGTPDILESLIDDAEYMLGRMDRRAGEYRRFAKDARELHDALDSIAAPALEQAREAMNTMRDRLRSREKLDIAEIDEAAESVRAVANAQEHTLRACKELALKLSALLAGVKGNRSWEIDENEAESQSAHIREKYQAWLPPEPHGGLLAEWIARGRAAVVEKTDNPLGEPVAEFEDGGAIPMSRVRWDDSVRNFHRAGFKPGATGRQYRGS